MRSTSAQSFLVGVALVLAGCGGSPSDDLKPEISKFGAAYADYCAGHRGLSPSRLFDMTWIGRETFPNLEREIQAGRFVVIWDAVMTANTGENDKYILAYEQTTPEEGGWVLRAGGTVQKMSAAEFKEFPKIKTRTTKW